MKNILVYADPAAKVEPALRRAARLARRNHGLVTIVDFLDRSWSSSYDDFGPTPAERLKLLSRGYDSRTIDQHTIRARLQHLCARLRRHCVAARAKVLIGRTATEIGHEVQRYGYDVVIKTAQGERQALAKPGFLGTAVAPLIRKCPCPVWIVDPEETASPQRIVAALDIAAFDSASVQLNREVLINAAQIAADEHGELHVVQAWMPYGQRLLGGRLTDFSLRKSVDDARGNATRQAEEIIEQLPQLISRDRIHLLQGDPEQAISSFVSEQAIELVVTGTTNRSRLSELIISNTVRKVLQQVQSSVLVIKPRRTAGMIQLDPVVESQHSELEACATG